MTGADIDRFRVCIAPFDTRHKRAIARNAEVLPITASLTR